MEILTLILLLLAHSLGIATLIVQVICYIRKIEYLETIILVVSFYIHYESLAPPNLFPFQEHANNV